MNQVWSKLRPLSKLDQLDSTDLGRLDVLGRGGPFTGGAVIAHFQPSAVAVATSPSSPRTTSEFARPPSGKR